VNFTIEMSNPETSGVSRIRILAIELVLDTIFSSKNHLNRHFGKHFNSKCARGIFYFSIMLKNDILIKSYFSKTNYI